MKITINNVSKQIKGRTILKNSSLEFESGEIVGITGPNGSGKTMLMRAILGFIKPDEGTVFVDDQEIGKDIDFPQDVGFLLETPAFLDTYTGLVNLKLLAEAGGVCDMNAIREALIRVNLDPDDRRKYKQYSLGMKQRLGIAHAIMQRPGLIMLDEPTNALDKKGIDLIEKIILEEKARGAAIMLICHDKEFVSRVADRLYHIEEGTLNEGLWNS